MRRPLTVAAAALLVCNAHADLYLHNPRGSNNKLNEVSNNARNQNRLFDSQNNAAGGYQVGDDCKPVCSNANNRYDKTAEGAGKGQMKFYEGSRLTLEWTNQHGSGRNPRDHTQVVIQYACEGFLFFPSVPSAVAFECFCIDSSLLSGRHARPDGQVQSQVGGLGIRRRPA